MKKYLTLLLTLMMVEAADLTDSFLNAAPRYQKREAMITMRDGVKLYTAIYEPIDSVPCPQGHPIMMSRTCYSAGPYGLEGDGVERRIKHPGDQCYMDAGYIFVYQDVRGKNMSEGVFEDVRPFVEGKKTPKFRKDGTVIVNKKMPTDEASDTYETCEWLVKNTNSNGCIGVKGISYPGFYSTMAALSGHPALKAVSPQAPVTDWWRGDDVHHNGAFAFVDMFSFQFWFEYMMKKEAYTNPDYLNNLKSAAEVVHTDLYDSYLRLGTISDYSKLLGDSVIGWNMTVEHPDLDEYWESTNVTAGHCHDVKPAIMVVGGLFDAEDCYGAFQTYRAIKTQSPDTHLSLVEGPWAHGLWNRGQTPWFGPVYFGNEITSEWYMENIELPFFSYYLEGKGAEPFTGVKIFDTGALKWHEYSHDAWANRNWHVTEPFYLVPENGKALSYVSDPMHPVPYTAVPGTRRTTTYMLDDQRFASRRPDVLTIDGSVLTEPLTLCGPVDVVLNVSLSTTDADFVVKLIDVFPDDFAYADSLYTDGGVRSAGRNGNGRPLMAGYQMLVRWEIMRGKYRNTAGVDNINLSLIDVSPVPFKPGEVTSVRFRLNDVQHTFLPGHRVMVQVQSSMFPLFDRNPQQFVDIYHCSQEDFVPCTVTLHPGSKLLLPVVK